MSVCVCVCLCVCVLVRGVCFRADLKSTQLFQPVGAQFMQFYERISRPKLIEVPFPWLWEKNFDSYLISNSFSNGFRPKK